MVSLAAFTDSVGTAMKRSNPDVVFNPKRKIERLASGDFVFDAVSGGGFPRRRISEVFGMEHSGKSSLLYAAMAKVQKAGGVAVLIDAETVFDPIFAKNVFGLEVDNKTFVVLQPENAEEADAIIDKLFTLDKLDIVGFDSVDAMKPKVLIEGTLEKGRRPGAHAQAMSLIVAKVKNLAKQKNCAAVFINQMRVNITTNQTEQNVGTGAGYNTQETHTVTGGYSLRFYASLRIKLEYGGQIRDETGENALSGEQEKIRIGNFVKVINIKNKCSTPFLKGLASFFFPMKGQKGGWNDAHEVLELLKKRGRIRQASTRFIYNGLNVKEWTKVGSKAGSEEEFMKNPDLIADARALLLHLMDTSEGPGDVLEIAVPGQDFLESEVSGQDANDASEEGQELSLSALTGGNEALADETPVEPIQDVTV